MLVFKTRHDAGSGEIEKVNLKANNVNVEQKVDNVEKGVDGSKLV